MIYRANKQFNYFISIFFILSLILTSCQSQRCCLDLLDLDRAELKSVRDLYCSGHERQAMCELKKYYENRTNIKCLDEERVCNSISETQKNRAKEALEHKFYVLDAYEPLSYGDDINWEYWPIKDMELRWQLHRMYWWSSLGKAYHYYNDEKYAKEWVDEYCDWVVKNPLSNYDKNKTVDWDCDDNQYFAWRPLETGIRLSSQIENFTQMLKAESFTPEFLNVFLLNYHQHMEHLHKFYSPSCNHRITEAQGMLEASVYFPEFKDSKKFRDEAISILNEEINRQVYDDGMQIELDPSYHIESISTFSEVVRFCKLNNIIDAFPNSYLTKLNKMIDVARRFIYPDKTMVLFSDSRQYSDDDLEAKLQYWQNIYPDNGENASSKALDKSGFYFLCNGHDYNSTIMIVKAGPPAWYHCQPDNGTFEYWRKGRNFFPDTGCYIYSGDDAVNESREWFRQTRVHNTLTLDRKNLEETDSRLIKFIDSETETILRVENQSYKNLVHNREVKFMKDGTVEITDIASGDAEGVIQLNYNLSVGEWLLSDNALTSKYSDGNNISISVTSTKPVLVKREEGRLSKKYGDYIERPSYSFNVEKRKGETIIYKTIIKPIE